MKPSRARRALPVLLVAVTLAAAVGCGETAATMPGLSAEVVEVTMTEMRFTPSSFTFHVGDTVTFRFHNKGTVRHEAVIGDAAAQQAAMQAMAAMATTTLPPAQGKSRLVVRHPGMGLPNLISVEAGKSGDITFSFAKATTLLMQCHERGHLEAGMTATIVIEP